MYTPQILLVDDDPALLEALPRLLALRIQGVQVDRANSAIEALRSIQRCDYDAIISDILMPGLDGLELLERIKALRPSTPTLLITGQIEPSLLQRAMDAGAYDFIQKPIERLSFVAALKRALQMRQLQRQSQQQQYLLASYARAVGPLTDGVPALTGNQQVSSRTATPFQPPRWLL